MDIELHSIDPSRFRHWESGQFIVRFLTDFQNLGLDATQDLVFKAMFDDLIQQSPEYQKALRQIRTKDETSHIESLDDHRYRKVMTLRRAYKVFEYSDLAPEQEAYQALNPVFSKYKNVEIINFEAKSYSIDLMIKVLRKAQNLPAVQLLKLEVHINTLEASNETFKTMFNQRTSSIINTPVYDTAAMRKAIYETYKSLVEYTMVMAKRTSTPFYLETIEVLNYGRVYYADLIAKRKGVSKVRRNKKEE